MGTFGGFNYPDGSLDIPLSPFDSGGGSALGSLLDKASPVLGSLFGAGGLPGFSASSSASSAADSNTVLSSSFGVAFDAGRVSGVESNPDVDRGAGASASAGTTGPTVTPAAGDVLEVPAAGSVWLWIIAGGAGLLALAALARRR